MPAARSGWRVLARALPRAVGLGLTVLAALAIERTLRQVSFDSVTAAYERIPDPALALALLLTAVSFAAIAVYDLIAVETVAPGKIPRVTALATGAGGYAVSNALGFPILTQGAFRMRAYGAHGGGLADVGRVLGASWFALLMSLVTMTALALVCGPEHFHGLGGTTPLHATMAGLAVLGLVAGMVAWLGATPRVIRLRGFTLRLPTSRAALLQISAGVVDITAAAATLYVLLPAYALPGFPAFLLAYIAATLVGIASHAPGGLGAFEATLLAGLGLHAQADVLGALLAYRVIYMLLPFGAAILGLGAVELHRRRVAIARALRFAEPMVPAASAAIALAGGVMLLASGATRDLASRIAVLADVVPTPFVEASHFASCLVGVALLVIARGLYRRLVRAWNAALMLLVLGAGFSLGKGLDWEEATLLGALALCLALVRGSFYRCPKANPFTVTRVWLRRTAGRGPAFTALGALTAASAGLGFLLFTHGASADALWWQISWDGNGPALARVSFAFVIGLAAIGFDSAVNHRGRRRAAEPTIPADIAALVAASPSASAAMALLGDKEFLTAPGGDGFVMYARAGRSLVALGDPVGPARLQADLAWAFRELADRAAARPVFYGVGPDNLALFLDMGLTALKLGEVARVPLADFSLKGPARHDLRYGQRRAEKEGLTFEIVPQAQVRLAMYELRQVSSAWLAHKQGGEKRFSMGAFDPAYLARFDVAVMKKEGRIVAFANLLRGADRNEIAIDLIRYAPDASKVIMDALFANLLLTAKAEGYRWFNLGAAPLSGLVDRRLASRWNRFGTFLYRRGADLYSFDGLRSFKHKFDPVWTPYYLICPGGLQTPKTLLDVTTLVNGSPLGLIRR
ncbi:MULTISPECIES: bifunctional lysylphosphatidylglycerol flippase/synthetase MprF [Methylobacterium]|uniref:Phosphatidylglycerol lysyltransferase n=1 Tax=Methylobacterium thuringiense TaxID=1003091 RepID=A0ABQ4TQZ4_9HYPH|nr:MULTISPECIES: bifunctional lysylphosphatidylglycerol flippase/synthetase MprF [Methylobacterium]GJE57779.1 Phosphatidylglycerol lysyltransferase [Methylobacterium thuringiense]